MGDYVSGKDTFLFFCPALNNIFHMSQWNDAHYIGLSTRQLIASCTDLETGYARIILLQWRKLGVILLNQASSHVLFVC